MSHIRKPAPSLPWSKSRGLTLVELMVGLSIGMLVVASMSILFANNSRSRTETERASQKIENGRFALETIGVDLQHAGYFAELNPNTLITPAITVPASPCSTALADLRSAIPFHVLGVDNTVATSLCGVNNIKAGTDVIVIRRVSTATCQLATTLPVLAGVPVCDTGPAYFQASLCNDADQLSSTNTANHFRVDSDITAGTTLTRKARSCGAAAYAPLHRYILRIYYVSPFDKVVDGVQDGIPTLKRAEMSVGAGGALTLSSTSLVQGIENLQIEYGIDTDASGTANYGSPNGYMTAPTTTAQWTSAVSAKVYLLSRNIDASPGHVETKTYVLGLKANGDPESIDPSSPPDAYKRSVFQEVIRFRNVGTRRF